MLKKILALTSVAFSLIAQGQENLHEEGDAPEFHFHKPKYAECDSRVQQADSLINYSINRTTGEVTPVQVQQYHYDADGNLTEVYFLNLPSRTNYYHQVFEYDSNQNLIKYTNNVWNGSEWVEDLINTKTYGSENQILAEEFLRKNSSGQFSAYQRHFYHYQGNTITDYLRQIKNASGIWYDFSNHFYVYDSYSRLTVLYGKYVNNGPVFWERTAIYGDDGKVSERTLRILRYNQTLKMNVLTNSSYQLYSYNIYGNVNETLNHEWINGQWVNTNKDVYYYSQLKDKKVSICHNGHTICVSINAVDAHLAHGDKLGSCSDESDQYKNEQRRGGTNPGSDKEIHFDIYPNPAREQATIKLTGENNDYTRGEILASDGRVMNMFMIDCQNEITVNVGAYLNGNYIVRLYGKSGFDTKTLIKK